MLKWGIPADTIGIIVFVALLYGFFRYTRPKKFLRPFHFIKVFFSTYFSLGIGTVVLALYTASPWFVIGLAGLIVAILLINPVD